MARDDPRTDETVARVLPNGRLHVPAAVRRRMGLREGDRLKIEESDRGLVLRNVDQQVEEVRARLRAALGVDNLADALGTVDDFLRERRAMWGED